MDKIQSFNEFRDTQSKIEVIFSTNIYKKKYNLKEL